MKVHARFRQLRSTGCRSTASVTILAVAFCFAAPFADAQSTGGRIRGTVMDTSGGAVPAASVTLINEATHATRDVQSGANGEYIFLEVPVGTYEIDAISKGFNIFNHAQFYGVDGGSANPTFGQPQKTHDPRLFQSP